MKRTILTEDERERVANAIKTAEQRTSGEIICVLARRSDGYFYIAAFVLTLAMLVTSVIAALVIDRLWIAVPLWQFVAAQLLALGVSLALIGWLPDLRIRFVPRAVRYRRANRNAVSQFLGRNIHVTENRTGVLIFLSLAERYAEVIADAGINAHVSQETWDTIVADLVAHASRGEIADGFEGAIAAAGEILANTFPPTGDTNELDDHLVEI